MSTLDPKKKSEFMRLTDGTRTSLSASFVSLLRSIARTGMSAPLHELAPIRVTNVEIRKKAEARKPTRLVGSGFVIRLGFPRGSTLISTPFAVAAGAAPTLGRTLLPRLGHVDRQLAALEFLIVKLFHGLVGLFRRGEFNESEA